jgi:predicted transcriptional regulator of viral defense system
MSEILQLAEAGPELDALALKAIIGEGGNVRDRIRRLTKTGTLVRIVPGIYATAPELRKRPLSLEILANMMYGPSYVSFEYVLSRAGLIPEGVRGVSSATPRKNRDLDSPLGRFSYRSLPLSVYSFGWQREAYADGSGFLIARPEKALLDSLYRMGAVRSLRALKERLFVDLRRDEYAFRSLDGGLLASYAARMPGDTFRVHFPKLLEVLHE